MGTHVAKIPGRWRDGGRKPAERLRAFFAERIWDVRVADLRRGRALLYRASRVGYSAVNGFLANRLTVRAAALTYYSVLSVVPFLAFAFAVLKGFGAYTGFVNGTLRPYLERTFGANASLLGSLERILQFVERTNFSTLGAVGLLILGYTSVSLLSSIEDTLNEIWGVRARRPFLRQVTDYVTLLVTTPLLVVASATAVTAAESSSVVTFLRDALALGAVIDFLLRFSSLAIVGLAFFAVYEILPNVRVRPASAVIGAIVAAALWELALVLYVRFQVGVSGYNALYSVLSAIPIFLVWTYASWVVVLAGAQVAASHQNERLVRQRFLARRTDQDLRETLAVVLAAHVARAFLSGGPWPGGAEVATLGGVPPLAVEEILGALVRAGLLARTGSGGETGYLPARDPDTIRVNDLRAALRRDPAADRAREAVERDLGPELRRVLHDPEEEGRRSPQNVTLRELAALLAPGALPPAGPSERT